MKIAARHSLRHSLRDICRQKSVQEGRACKTKIAKLKKEEVSVFQREKCQFASPRKTVFRAAKIANRVANSGNDVNSVNNVTNVNKVRPPSTTPA